MIDLSREFIRDHLADSAVIFQRGVHLYENGSLVMKQADNDTGRYMYEYVVTLHDPANEQGHCNCPDFLTNRLGTCKHLIFTANYLKKKRGFKKRIAREKFPFVDIYWDSVDNQPRVFAERPLKPHRSEKPLHQRGQLDL